MLASGRVTSFSFPVTEHGPERIQRIRTHWQCGCCGRAGHHACFSKLPDCRFRVWRVDRLEDDSDWRKSQCRRLDQDRVGGMAFYFFAG